MLSDGDSLHFTNVPFYWGPASLFLYGLVQHIFGKSVMHFQVDSMFMNYK